MTHLVLALSLLLATTASADVLCVSSSGIVRLRAECKNKERTLPISIEDGGRTVRVTGANVQIVSGSGSTGGEVA